MSAYDYLNQATKSYKEFVEKQEFYRDEALAHAENEVRKARALMEVRTWCDLIILGVPGDMAKQMAVGAERKLKMQLHYPPRIFYSLKSNNLIVPITFWLTARDDGSESIEMPPELGGFGYYWHKPFFEMYTYDEDGEPNGLVENPRLSYKKLTPDYTQYNYDCNTIELAIGFARDRYLDHWWELDIAVATESVRFPSK